VAVETIPNDIYIVETLLEEFRGISRGNGNYTEVQHVEMPSWSLSDGNPNAFNVNPLVMTPKNGSPALYVWVDSSIPADGWVGMAERTLRIIVVGVIRQAEGLQLALMRLASDLRGVMLHNGERTFPGKEPQNTGATTTELPDGFHFNLSKNETSDEVGYFVSFWAVSHKFPSPRG